MAICRWLFFVGILSRCTSCLFRTACIFWHRCFILVILRGIRSVPLQSSVWVFSALCLGNTTKRFSNRIRSLQEQSAFWTYYFALLTICLKSFSSPNRKSPRLSIQANNKKTPEREFSYCAPLRDRTRTEELISELVDACDITPTTPVPLKPKQQPGVSQWKYNLKNQKING